MKKILSLVLSCSLVLGSFGMAFAAPADVDGTKYEDSVTRLAALEVLKGYEDNTFKPEKTITRAEFAKIMANVTGVGTAAQYAKGQTKFADVAAEHWAAGYINVVSDMGIINGYGDGNFGAEDQVTYAQAITMIVRALGYTPKANAMGGYPGGYLAVAAEKEITDDVSVVSSLAATRGDVAIMVNNSLTVDLMEQITYGQYPEYKEVDGKNLMTTKLDVEELEGTVVAIPDTDSSLDDDEIILAIEDEDNETLTMKVDVDYMTLLGLEVKVWADGDDVFFLDIETSDKDIMFDSVDEVTSDEITLYVDGDDYEFDADVQVFINYEESKVKDIEAGMYGYVVLNKKDDVISANLFDFSTEGELVTEVDGDDVTLEGTADLDLADYDDGVYVFDKNFKTVDVDTIAEDTVVSYFVDGDEIWIVAVNDTVDGTLERASKSEIKVSGEEYDVRGDMLYSLDNKDDLDPYSANAELLDDLMEEAVTVLLDLNGEAKVVTGDVKETSGTMFALFQKGDDGFDAKIKVINTAGDEVTYEFEDEDDFVSGLNKNDLVAFELNKDGEIADGTFLSGVALDNDDYDIEANGNYDIDDDGYIELGTSSRYYVEDDTVFFNVEGGDGEELTFADVEDVDVAVKTLYVIKEDKGNDLVAVVFENAGVASKSTNYAIVVEEPDFDGDWKVTLNVAGEGEVEYAIDGTVNSARKAEYTEGNVLDFRLNTDNEIITETVHSNAVKVDEVNGKYFLFGSDWLKVADDRVMYLLEDDGDLDKKLDYDDIEKDDKVFYVKDDDNKLAVVAVVTDPTVDTETPTTTDGTITYVNTTVGGESIVVDGSTPYVIKADTILMKADNTVVAGAANIAGALSKGDVIKVEGNIITVTSSAVAKIAEVTTLTAAFTGTGTAGELAAARTQYNKLNAETKKLAAAVTELQKIQSGELTIVGAMPVTTNAEVVAAKAAFNALPADTKVAIAPVSPTAAAVLGAIETAEASFVITDVEGLITAIPVKTDATFAAKVNAAKTAFDSLTSAQKGSVTNVATLTTALTDLAELNNVAEAKAALTTLAFDTTNNAGHAEPQIVKPAAHANGATYTLGLGAIPAGETVAGTDPVVITRGAAEFKFDITVTITDTGTTDTKVFEVTVPVTGNTTVVAK